MIIAKYRNMVFVENKIIIYYCEIELFAKWQHEATLGNTFWAH